VIPGATSETKIVRDRAGLESTGTILQDRFSEFHVSIRGLRKTESIQLIRERRTAAS
jgi:hypothetical protein